MLNFLRGNSFKIGIAAFCLGIIVAALFGIDLRPAKIMRAVKQSDFKTDKKHPHVDALLMMADEGDAGEYKNLKLKLLALVGNRLSDASVTSIFFRDLHSIHTFEINASERYSPASLMKVPLMISILNYADEHPAVLRQKLEYTGSVDYNALETVKGKEKIEPHHSYTIDDLLKRMILYSDNNASVLLSDYASSTLGIDPMALMTDLGIKELDASKDYMTVYAYSRFFRVLYNSSYLDRRYSEYAISQLLDSQYDEGIRSTVPKGTEVAEKFGEYQLLENSTGRQLKRELHDCAIVYYPKRPYLLCVMTKGSDLPALQKLIADISRTTYEYIAKQ